MDISISARHIDLSDSMKRVTREKMERLARYAPDLRRAEVHFSEEKNPRVVDREVCEVMVEGAHGRQIRGKATASDTLVAVDRAVAKLEHQMARLKTKANDRTDGRG